MFSTGDNSLWIIFDRSVFETSFVRKALTEDEGDGDTSG
jgi:hypothetical protein